MRYVKNAIEKILAAFGYELKRLRSRSVLFENFLNLTKAYEQCVNDHDALILPNEVRPKLLARLMGTPPSEAYFIVQALSKCKDVPGDVCEFGVAQGETSALIANEIAQFSNKCLHLFDSFEGLPNPSDKDQLKDDIYSFRSIESYAGTMSYPVDKVLTYPI
jgi:O-methyltransferase